MTTIPIAERLAGGGYEVAAVLALKHAELWEASQKLGSQAELARRLDVSASDISSWVSLRACPPKTATRAWPQERLDKLEKDLFEITGKLLDELFPDALRENTVLHKRDRFAVKRLKASAAYASLSLQYDPTETFDELEWQNTLAERMDAQLQTLTHREQNILKLRFGIGDALDCYTLEEVGEVFKISRERVRSIEAKAIRKLQQPSRSSELVSFLEADA